MAEAVDQAGPRRTHSVLFPGEVVVVVDRAARMSAAVASVRPLGNQTRPPPLLDLPAAQGAVAPEQVGPAEAVALEALVDPVGLLELVGPLAQAARAYRL